MCIAAAVLGGPEGGAMSAWNWAGDAAFHAPVLATEWRLTAALNRNPRQSRPPLQAHGCRVVGL